MMGDTAPNPHERRAQALAEITKMQADLVAANATIEELETELRDTKLQMQHEVGVWQDRALIEKEERTMYRAQAMLYQRKLVELATSMADIGLLTQRAQKVMDTVQCLLGGEDPAHAEAEQASAAEIVKNLPQAPLSVQDQMVADLDNLLVATKGQHVATESAVKDEN